MCKKRANSLGTELRPSRIRACYRTTSRLEVCENFEYVRGNGGWRRRRRAKDVGIKGLATAVVKSSTNALAAVAPECLTYKGYRCIRARIVPHVTLLFHPQFSLSLFLSVFTSSKKRSLLRETQVSAEIGAPCTCLIWKPGHEEYKRAVVYSNRERGRYKQNANWKRTERGRPRNPFWLRKRGQSTVPRWIRPCPTCRQISPPGPTSNINPAFSFSRAKHRQQDEQPWFPDKLDDDGFKTRRGLPRSQNNKYVYY